ncbi:MULTISPECIES: methylenetetrahydrofolate reductase [NAD(P)H] [Muribaculum]|jgi:methylenetetrahydrofolate reductase (NAD(P)H)|uniref:methylenetetrahydrofolate reductase [NAD(P)H] n=4 Tax=Muribaculaceae TaxID=2005473 RepID=UPI000F4A4BA6|nr:MULTISPECIES: methylenetetrahydrofolate reductase [NAD(P)H] [Muribaculum]MCX4277675.1 methylenetetrahydrofolate reductase [NAD(P)H] [Muribaculum sp.]ROT13078.1 methylenetetrahydrofolate reductase [NAD(P)H] [Muribaculaceae bacterium Isolate-102 (HZI)]
MKVTELIASHGKTGFSFEVLPPLKGKGIAQLFRNIDILKEFNPLFINITTHRSEMVYKNTPDGLYQKVSERSRPGTVAVAAAIQQKYNIPAVPHIICSGFSKIETEYALIDLNFLGITNILILRGDKAKHESRFIPNENGYSHASELQLQINEFNRGYFIDGTKMDIITGETFSYGVAGYPEKHDESPNLDMDIAYLKQKIDNGAEYVVTQMFFDNSKYYDFVDRCRKAGINVPIIPGLRPITTIGQLNILPKIFHVDMPMQLVSELMKCKDDNDAKEVGVEWCKAQCLDLMAHGVQSIHFYSLNSTRSVERVAASIY